MQCTPTKPHRSPVSPFPLPLTHRRSLLKRIATTVWSHMHTCCPLGQPRAWPRGCGVKPAVFEFLKTPCDQEPPHCLTFTVVQPGLITFPLGVCEIVGGTRLFAPRLSPRTSENTPGATAPFRTVIGREQQAAPPAGLFTRTLHKPQALIILKAPSHTGKVKQSAQLRC